MYKKVFNGLNGISKINLQRVGKSDVYLTETGFAVLIKGAGRNVIYEDIKSTVKPNEIKTIHDNNERGEYYLTLIGEELDDSEWNSSAYGCKGTIDGNSLETLTVDKAARSLKTGSLKEQLLKLDFKQDGRAKNLFRKVITDRGEKKEIIIVLKDDNKIERILAPLRKEIKNRLPKNGRLVNYGIAERQNKHDNEITTHVFIKIADNNIEIILDKEDSSLLSAQIDRVRIKDIKERQMSDKELDVVEIPLELDEGGMHIGGKTHSIYFKDMKSINGISIEDLESKMKNKNKDFDYSFIDSMYFLGKDESLLKVLSNDNETVLSKNLIHSKLSHPLRYAKALYEKYLRYSNNKIYKYGEDTYEMKVSNIISISSPFDKKSSSDKQLTITNLRTGKSVTFDAAMTETIGKYGFYGGVESERRVDPKDIIDTFFPQ